MKKLKMLLMAGMLACCAPAFAQSPLNSYDIGVKLSDVIDNMQSLLQPGDTLEGGSQDRLNEFSTFWRDRVVVNDSSASQASGINMFSQYCDAARKAAAARPAMSCGSGYHGDWETVGPDSMERQVMGYVNTVWADPSDSNYILAGTLGGLFKTTDGGRNWSCITDNAPIVYGLNGISSIAVNPLNKNEIYLGTSNAPYLINQAFNGSWSVFGAGIIKSNDGGLSWEQEVIPINANYYDSVEEVSKVYLTEDTGRLYALADQKVFTRPNTAAGTWTEITPTGLPSESKWGQIAFVPGDPSHFFLCNMPRTGHTYGSIWESTVAVPDTSDWTKATAAFSDSIYVYQSTFGYAVGDGDFQAICMSIPDTDTLFAIFMCEDNPSASGLFKYNLTGTTHSWERINKSIPHALDPPDAENPAPSHFILAVSKGQTDSNLGRRNLYYGNDALFHSYDGGKSFVQIGAYYGDPTHGDIRSICIQQDSNSLRGMGDRVYIATDGGVSERTMLF